MRSNAISCTSWALTRTLIWRWSWVAREQGWDVVIHMNHISLVVWLNQPVKNKNGLVAGIDTEMSWVSSVSAS